MSRRSRRIHEKAYGHQKQQQSERDRIMRRPVALDSRSRKKPHSHASRAREKSHSPFATVNPPHGFCGRRWMNAPHAPSCVFLNTTFSPTNYTRRQGGRSQPPAETDCGPSGRHATAHPCSVETIAHARSRGPTSRPPPADWTRSSFRSFTRSIFPCPSLIQGAS